MPYTTIPTRADGDVLSAAYLNIIADDIEFLHGLGNAANPPFNSWRGTVTTLDDSDARWEIRHRLQYLHFRVASYGGPWEYARIYYNGIKVAGDEGAHENFVDVADLNDITSWPNYVGAWALSTAYEDDVNGDGSGGNSDDGSLVSHGGSFWRCILAHTSASTDEPGVGVNTATYWQEIAPPTVGTIYALYADVNYSGGTETGVEYMIETDSASL